MSLATSFHRGRSSNRINKKQEFLLFEISFEVKRFDLYRSRYGDEELEVRYGLWEWCDVSYENGTTECRQFKCPDVANDENEVCGKIIAARAFVTLACIFSGLSIIFFCISAATNGKTRFVLLLIGKFLTFFSLIMSIIGVAIGIIGSMDILAETDFKWGGCPVIAIIGIAINFLAALVSLLVQ